MWVEEVFVEVTELPGSVYPQVAGTKSVAEFCEDTEFVESAINAVIGEDQRLPAGADE